MFANLAQNVKSAAYWFDCFVFFHSCLVAGFKPSSQHFFRFSVGWLCTELLVNCTHEHGKVTRNWLIFEQIAINVVQKSKENNTKAFTLIELLVVIAVIAILAALLLPALNNAKMRGQEAMSISNQKQLATAWVMYNNDNNDNIIGFDCWAQNAKGTMVNPPTGTYIPPWRYEAQPQMYIPNPPSIGNISAEEKDILLLQTGYKQGGLWQYAPNVNVLHDPADKRAEASATAVPPAESFAWGSYSGVCTLRGENPTWGLTKAGEILHPSDRFLWVEENDPRGENEGSWQFTPGTASEGFTDAGFSDHLSDWFNGNTTTFSWADGHAETHKWLDAATLFWSNNPDTAPVPSYATAPDDLVWVAEHEATTNNP